MVALICRLPENLARQLDVVHATCNRRRFTGLGTSFHVLCSSPSYCCIDPMDSLSHEKGGESCRDKRRIGSSSPSGWDIYRSQRLRLSILTSTIDPEVTAIRRNRRIPREHTLLLRSTTNCWCISKKQRRLEVFSKRTRNFVIWRKGDGDL